jgi:hypothetical protein
MGDPGCELIQTRGAVPEGYSSFGGASWHPHETSSSVASQHCFARLLMDDATE